MTKIMDAFIIYRSRDDITLPLAEQFRVIADRIEEDQQDRPVRFAIGSGRCISIDGKDSVYVAICKDQTTRYAIAPAYADDMARLITELLNESPKAHALAEKIVADNARQRARA